MPFSSRARIRVASEYRAGGLGEVLLLPGPFSSRASPSSQVGQGDWGPPPPRPCPPHRRR